MFILISVFITQIQHDTEYNVSKNNDYTGQGNVISWSEDECVVCAI